MSTIEILNLSTMGVAGVICAFQRIKIKKLNQHRLSSQNLQEEQKKLIAIQKGTLEKQEEIINVLSKYLPKPF